jgi:hypothetical protein
MTDLGKVILGILSKAKEIMKSKKPIRVADIITDYVQIFNQEDFILKKRYRVTKSLTSTFGKWPSIYGNAVFFDSKYMV